MKRVRDSDPERLELSDPALKRALSSLADDGPSAAELQRMRQRLMGVVESAPSSRAPLLDLVRSPVGALLIGLGLAAGIGLVRYKQERDAAQEAAAIAPRASDEAFAAAESVAPAEHVDSQPSAVRGVADEVAPWVGSPEPAQASAARPALKRPRHAFAAAGRAPSGHELAAASAPAESVHGSLATGAAPTRAPDAPASTTVSKATAPSAGRLVAPTEGARASSVGAPSPTPVRAEAPPPAPAPLDEASLLQRARQLAASEPEGSLRLLNEHKRRFSHGMLTPEREVLAIELLRSLSRRGEAARRLEEFRRNFPDSVYLQRLEP